MSLFCQSPFFEQVLAPFVGIPAHNPENYLLETILANSTTGLAGGQEMPEKHSDSANYDDAKRGEKSNCRRAENAARSRA